MARSSLSSTQGKAKTSEKKIFKSHQQGSPIGATRLKRDEEYLCHWLHEHMTYSAQLLTYSFEMCILPITIISEKEINTISKVKEGRKNCQSKKRKRSMKRSG